MAEIEMKQLTLLKEKLQNQKMSVLVGAGFSKNVSSIFPSWWELLYDMTYFLYKSEIEESWNSKNLKKPNLPTKNKFIEEKINYFILKVGYLEIVSEYIKRKGFREAITSYIEEKTPAIVKIGEKFYLTNTIKAKKNKIEIQNKMLSQHKLLLQLPWNNIYTTNYDELLEFSNDTLTSEYICNEILLIQTEIDDLLNHRTGYQKEYDHLENENNLITNEINSIEAEPELLLSKKPDLTDLRAKLNSVQSKQKDITYKLQRLKKKIKDKERELLQLKKAFDDCISTVANASELSVKRNKNIIKLHGSIRNPNVEYGFDGDIQKQYVIAKEDYETYPQKHEAFTQLMRISLLQESYCLIGFSGDDTNFLEWIKWVREILRREKRKDDDYKIYLIDIKEEPIPSEKQLFFENHNVFPIRIMRDQIINFLESNTGYKLKERKDPKAVIELFLKYLRGKLQVNMAKATYELLQVNKYKRLWESLSISSPEKFDYKVSTTFYKNLADLNQYSRLPSLHFIYSNRKHNLLVYSALLIKNAPTKKDRFALLQIILLAIQDSYLIPTDFVWEKEEAKIIFKKFKEGGNFLKNNFLKLQLRESVLKVDIESFEEILSNLPKKKDDSVIYNSIILKAFQFDFKNLLNELESWDPESHWLVKKAGLLALFDSRKAMEYLYDRFENSERSSQEELYLLEMYSYVRQSVIFDFEKDLNESINGYKNVGLSSISENIDHLIEQVNRNKNSLNRYGEGRFRISEKFSFSNEFTNSQKGLQFIQVLVETGIPLSVAHVNFKKPEECYPLFKTIFEHLPYPVIFYSLQFSNQKFVRRLGQDFAYSEHLYEDLESIVKVLLDTYLDENTPAHYSQSILFFVSELVIATDPLSWQDNFYAIWEMENFRSRAYKERWEAERIFTKACLPYIQNSKILKGLMNSIIETSSSDQGIEFLYHLAKNPMVKKKGESLQFVSLTKNIISLINSMDKNENNIFMLGNIYSILNNSQKKLVHKKLELSDFNNFQNERIWGVLVFFSKGENQIITKIKDAIIKNRNLFNAGFTDVGLSSGVGFIEISRLSNPINSSRISWTTEEANKIFERLKIELQKIDSWLSRREHDFKFILHEMLLFIEYEQQKIENSNEFYEVFEKVKTLYYSNRKYDSLIDGILSPDHSSVVWALSEFSVEVYKKSSMEDSEMELSAILNKILLQSEPSIEASLKYLANWINNENFSITLKKYKEIISKILDRYTAIELVDFDKPFVYEQLIAISKKLADWKVKNENIPIWKDFESKSRFNNIKYGTEH